MDTMDNGNVLKVTTESSYRNIIFENKHKLIVVDFSAEWCQPCRYIYPKFVKLSKKYENVIFIHVDVEKSSIEDAKNIDNVPSFKFYFNQNIIYDFIGSNLNFLENAIKNYC